MVTPMYPVPCGAESKGASDVKWFAGLAMQAIIEKRGIPETESARDEFALWAYRMAQAMVRAEQTLHAAEN